jgi:hypothetical protein
MSIVSARRRLRQEDCKFEASLSYIVRLSEKQHTHTHTHTHKEKKWASWLMPVIPNYSGGRDQEDHSMRQA